jgi:hypothetical protein
MMREHAALIAILLTLMQNLVRPALVSPTTRGRSALTAVSPQPTRRRQARRGHVKTLHGHRASPRYACLADFDEFDVVEYARNETGPVELGVIRDGCLQPLCCWQEADPVELVWDEDEEPLETVHTVLNAVDAFPQQRLIDGGLGPNNPHGEESEDVYFVDRSDLSEGTVVALREDREVWW